MSALPQRLAKEPHVRALGMTAHRLSERQFVVTGGSNPHTVIRAQGALVCDCTAAKYGRFCAHIAAIHNMQKEATMALVLNRGQERGTPVALPSKHLQTYAGLFSSWWLHDGQYGTSVGVKCLVTHIAAGTKGWEKLEKITEAVTFLSPSWFYNAKKSEASNLMRLVHALTNLSYERLDPIDVEEVKKLLNESIGVGILFSAEVTEKGNGISKKTFDVADAAFTKLADQMAAKIEIRENKDANKYIAKPQPAYEDEPASVSSEEPADEVPF